jgi:hypothetical protein
MAQKSVIKGADVQPGQVIKIGGRWLRVTKRDRETSGGLIFVATVKHDHDGRLDGKLRVIFADQEYPVREQAAPVWGWVTREIERKAIG